MLNSEQIWERIRRGVFVIAEAGKNFIKTKENRPVTEYLENAKELVDRAAWAGADAIKFQTHDVEDEQHPQVVVTAAHFKDLDRLAWVTRNTNATPVNGFWKPLKEHCEKRGIVFFSTPMSRAAAKRLSEVGVPLWKIGSGDILDYPMLDYLRSTNQPIIMSSGASTLEEVMNSLLYLRAKNKRVALTHAFSKYPGKPEEANLAVIESYRELFPDVPVGFSENSIGITPSLIAVALGATIIEKHFAIDRNLWGADHKVCSTPEEFKEMVSAIRLMESRPEEKARWLNRSDLPAILGSRLKVLHPDEAEFRPVFQKSLVAGMDIPAGAKISAEMVYAVRPRRELQGFPSEMYEFILGATATKDIKKYESLDWYSLK